MLSILLALTEDTGSWIQYTASAVIAGIGVIWVMSSKNANVARDASEARTATAELRGEVETLKRDAAVALSKMNGVELAITNIQEDVKELLRRTPNHPDRDD